jgi:TRAP-type C4-dicarboxylate transport system permease small subunit
VDAPTSSPLSHSNTPFDKLIDALAWIAGFLLVALVILVCVDVAVRNAPDVVPGLLSLILSDESVQVARKSMQTFSMPWIPELNEYLLYTITFFGAPWVLRDQGHIVVDLVTQTLSPAAKRRAAFVSYLIGAVVCLLLCYYAVLVMIRSISSGNMVVKTWEFPEWIPQMVAPPMFLILALIFIRWLYRPPPLDDGSDTGDGA